MKLYLHIGSHKSGSTSIQSFIEDNQALLGKAGYYIDENLTYRDQWQIAAWAGYPGNADYFVNTMKAFDDNELKRFVARYPDEFRSKLTATQRDKSVHSCLISSEFLYSQCSTESAIENLAFLFKSVFSSVTVIFYFRDQVSMAKSVYSQLVDGPAKAKISYEEFVETITEESEFNYAMQLKKWATHFGTEHIRVAQVGSNNGCLQGEALLHHFAKNLNSANLPYHFRKKDANRSPSYQALRLIRQLNRIFSNTMFNVSYDNMGFRVIRKLIKSLPLKGQFPPHLDNIIAKRLDTSNKEISRLFGANERD